MERQLVLMTLCREDVKKREQVEWVENKVGSYLFWKSVNESQEKGLQDCGETRPERREHNTSDQEKFFGSGEEG